MITRPSSILLSACGGTVGRLIVKLVRDTLGSDAVIIATDCDAEMGHLSDVAEVAKLPHASDPAYIESINEIVARRGVELFMPLSEEECLVASIASDRGNLNCEYVGVNSASLKLIQDKTQCAAILRNSGLVVPEFGKFESRNSFFKLAARLGYPQRPVILRPYRGRGSRGLRVISENFEERSEYLRQGGRLFGDIESIADEIFRSNYFSDLFLTEYLPGESYSVDLVCWHGELLGCFPHLRRGYRWGFVDCAEIVFDPDIEAYCSRACSILNLHGLCNIELGLDDHQTLSLIEVNARTSATAAQNTLVGANLFEIFVKALTGKKEYYQWSGRTRYRTYTDFSEIKV